MFGPSLLAVRYLADCSMLMYICIHWGWVGSTIFLVCTVKLICTVYFTKLLFDNKA